MKAIVLDQQSLFDIAIQHCGAAEAAYDIAVLNDISITDDLTAGQAIILPDPINKDIAKYYKDKALCPATRIGVQPTPIKYGALYNVLAVNDSRGLAPEGWHIATKAEWEQLFTFIGGTLIAGGKLKSKGLFFWNTPNTGATNAISFNGKGGGQRFSEGTFTMLKSKGYYWTGTPGDFFGSNYSFGVSYDSAQIYVPFRENAPTTGYSVRAVKNDSSDPGTLIDIDGNVYPTVKIGDQVWMAENLMVTKYKNGDLIPEVLAAEDWLVLVTGARCFYDNNSLNR